MKNHTSSFNMAENHFSTSLNFIQRSMLAMMNNSNIYIFWVFKIQVSINIADNYVGICFHMLIMFKCHNHFLKTKFNVNFYEERYDVYIYIFFNQVSSINRAENHYLIFIYY